MWWPVKLFLVGLSLFLGVGIVTVFIARVRYSAESVHCTNNLRVLSLTLGNYYDTYNHLPAATIANPALVPDQRLSWYGAIAPFIEQCGPGVNQSKPWNAEENYPPTHAAGIDDPRRIRCGPIRLFQCPANPNRGDGEVVSYTHYVGVAGVGEEIAYGPKEYPFAGVFGYDRSVSLEDIKDGPSHTLMVIETANANGPWTRGGPSTVRALDPDRLPYLGPNGQFSSFHRPHVTHALFADGSVHALKESMDPRVFAALATIAGHEEVGDDY